MRLTSQWDRSPIAANWLFIELHHCEGWIGSLGLAEANYYVDKQHIMDKQQGPIVWHKELYPIFCNKP